MPRADRVFARPAALTRGAADVVAARLDEVSDACVIDPRRLDELCSTLLPEEFPPPADRAGRRVLSARAVDALREILTRLTQTPALPLSASEWSVITRTLLPEHYADRPCLCRVAGALCGMHRRLLRERRRAVPREDAVGSLLRLDGVCEPPRHEYNVATHVESQRLPMRCHRP